MDNSIQHTLEKAQSAFLAWRKTTFESRQQLIQKLALTFSEQKENLASIITGEMHKPITQAVAEIEKCILMMEYYAIAENVLQSEKVDTEYDIAEIHYAPMGVIIGVMPWNFPFWQAMRFIIPAVLAGNTTVLKHASICFGSGNAIEKLFIKTGFPQGIFQNLEIGHAEVQDLLKNKIIQAVSLTGSGKAGGEVAGIAGSHIKKSLLELGGSDAFIVLNDADLQQAAIKGAKARLQNCGQACNAAKRFIIQKNIYEQFLPLFLAAYQEYKPGDPMNKDTTLSGMARTDLADELENQYQIAVKNGAQIILPLERVSENAFNPGLILVQPGNPILEEELFGPLGMVMLANDDAHALELANGIPFGLANSIWTKDKNRLQYFIENLHSGTVSLNKESSSDPRLPFGGTKISGYGSELSLHALKEFVTLKTVVGMQQ